MKLNTRTAAVVCLVLASALRNKNPLLVLGVAWYTVTIAPVL